MLLVKQFFFFNLKWLRRFPDDFECTTSSKTNIVSGLSFPFNTQDLFQVKLLQFTVIPFFFIFGLTFSADHFSWECSAYLLAKCSSFSGRAKLEKKEQQLLASVCNPCFCLIYLIFILQEILLLRFKISSACLRWCLTLQY